MTPSTLTLPQILTLVLGRSGRQEGNTYFVSALVTEAQLIQTELEGDAFLPWFLVGNEITTLSTVVSQRTLTIPTNFLREYDDFPLYRYDSAAADPYIKMQKDEFDILESQYGGAPANIPLQYALVGDQLHFFPTPNAVYPLRWKVFESQAPLAYTGVTTNAWTQYAPDLLIGKIGMILNGMYKNDPARFQMFAGEALQARQRLIAFDIARGQALRDAQRGS